jgi:BlaI family penicillinase repressor
MPRQKDDGLSRRERQIMDILYREGRATAAEVQKAMPEAPGYSAVRAMLRVLEDKGHVTHEQDGLTYVYRPKVSPQAARRSAVSHLLETFFEGSPGQAVAAVLEASDARLSRTELDQITALIERARKEGR